MQFENKVLSKEILFILYESGKTLATAESCTSGKVAESITLMPGASAYFTGGIVAYSEEVKKSLYPQVLGSHRMLRHQRKTQLIFHRN